MNGIVLIGPPCSGKSTVGKRVAELLRAQYVSSGDIARTLAKVDPITRDNLAQGMMAPEDRMRFEIHGILYNLNYAKKMFVLDGFPRFPDQLHWLMQRFPALLFYVLDTPYPICLGRMLNRGRGDDNHEVFQKRWTYHIKNTFAMLDDLEQMYGVYPTTITNFGTYDTPERVARLIVDSVEGTIDAESRKL